MMFDDRIAAPPIRGSYKLSEMKVGQSFEAPMEDYTRIAGACQRAKLRNVNAKFTMRKIEGGKVRCWRIA